MSWLVGISLDFEFLNCSLDECIMQIKRQAFQLSEELQMFIDSEIVEQSILLRAIADFMSHFIEIL